MDRTADPATLVRSLAETTVRVEAVAHHLSATELRSSPVPEGWSPNEILWHIRAVADVYGEHIRKILHDDTPTWRHVSPRARMKKARYDQMPFAESLAAFVQQRTALVTLLDGIPPEAWQRMAVVRVPFGRDPEWRLTLHERVRGMVGHEEGHCTQMENAAAALSQDGKREAPRPKKQR